MTLEAIELHFSSAEQARDDKLGDTPVIWKDILREGKFPITPGRKQRVPFEVTTTGPSSSQDRIISMSDLIESFDGKAFEDVTIPDGHPDPEKKVTALDNTGYVRALRVVKRAGKHFLQGALAFTEPDVAGKVRRGSVPNVSSGVFFDFTRKADGKTFRAALNHVCLTKQPWIDGLEPFKKVFAADSEDDIEIIGAEFDDSSDAPAGSEDGQPDKGEIVWNEKDGASWLRSALKTALAPPEQPPDRPFVPQPLYDVNDIAPTKELALVTEFFKGETTRWVIPFTVSGETVEPGPERRWTRVREALIAASDDNYDDVLYDTVKERLNASVASMENAFNFEIESVSLDQRCHIRNKDTGRVLEASFVRLPGGQMFLSDAADWKEVSPPNNKGVKQPAPIVSPQVTFSAEESTPEERVRAARQRRRQMLAGTSH